MLTESNEEAIKMGENDQVNVVVREREHDKWYSDIIYYMKNPACLNHLVDHKRRSLRLKSMKYRFTQYGLEWKNLDGVIPRCVNKDEVDMLTNELHSKYCDGHFASSTISHNILRVSYYWPTLFIDTHRYVRSCQPCQLFCRQTMIAYLVFEVGRC
jgi:hypothetical protein